MYNVVMEKKPIARPAGRPKGSRNTVRKDGVRINLYLDRQVAEDLWSIARANDQSRNQAVEGLVRKFMAGLPPARSAS